MTKHFVLSGALLLGTSVFGFQAATAAPQKATRKPVAAAKAKAPVRPVAKATALPAELKDVVGLDIAPASFQLDGPRAVQHLVVIGTLKDGATADVTDHVTLALDQPKLAKVVDGVVHPLADGKAQLTAKLGKLTSPVAGFTVVNAKLPATVDFNNDVMPILAKTGCNSTACHGSPAGKGGFKLSLFGYEPELDHVAIVKDGEGKRVNAKDPAQSLLLQKATLATPHAGGMRFKKDSKDCATLVSWIKDGAQGMGEFEARVKSIEVIPDQPWIPAPNRKQRLAVTALMSDGSTRDVTDKAIYSSNDDAIAEVSDAGLVTTRRAGETAVMVRFLGQVAVSRVAVLPTLKPQAAAQVAKHNYIDDHVLAKVQKLRMTPSELCTDEEFIRRATLDVCGIIPSPEEMHAFMTDRRSDKRARLVDQLLEREEFVDFWTVRWNDILRNNPRTTRSGAGAYATWIRTQLAKNRPYDEWVRDLVTATGRATEGQITIDQLPRNQQDRPGAQRLVDQVNRVEPNAAANYFSVSKDPLDVTSATSQIFLGVRIECARCHNHPFEKWTQNDYYGLAAFFKGLQVRGNAQVAAVVAINERSPEMRNPKTNEAVAPQVLDLTEIKVERGADRRTALAEWMTSPKNPWFAKSAVNRLWSHYFGRGIVEPVDDFRVTNPASNPELLDALAREFVDRKFDLKAVHRSILNSRTYQQSSRPNQYNATDTANFARFYPKRLMAEQIFDSISQATDIWLLGPGAGGRRPNRPAQPQFAGGRYMPAVSGEVKRVMQIPALIPGGARGAGGTVGQFLDTFGKPKREVVCECERSDDGNVGQALALINGEEVNRKISAPFGRIQRLARGTKPDPEMVEEIYLAILSRRPTPVEVNDASTLIRTAKSRPEGVEDLSWSLLNSREFLFNH